MPVSHLAVGHLGTGPSTRDRNRVLINLILAASHDVGRGVTAVFAYGGATNATV